MSSISIYKFPPENGVRYFLEKNIQDTSLKDRKIYPQIVQGHPLFVTPLNTENQDKFFPVIGIEWTKDTRQTFISQNFREFNNNKSLKEMIQGFKTVQQSERSMTDQDLDNITLAEKLQIFTYLVESEVIIAGFTSGGTGRVSLRALYESVDGLLEGVCHDIMAIYQGVKVKIDPSNEVNMQSEQFGFPVWGFEILLKITQPRITLRTKQVYHEDEIKKFDVHLYQSKTIFENIYNFNDIKY